MITDQVKTDIGPNEQAFVITDQHDKLLWSQTDCTSFHDHRQIEVALIIVYHRTRFHNHAYFRSCPDFFQAIDNSDVNVHIWDLEAELFSLVGYVVDSLSACTFSGSRGFPVSITNLF